MSFHWKNMVVLQLAQEVGLRLSAQFSSLRVAGESRKRVVLRAYCAVGRHAGFGHFRLGDQQTGLLPPDGPAPT